MRVKTIRVLIMSSPGDASITSPEFQLQLLSFLIETILEDALPARLPSTGPLDNWFQTFIKEGTLKRSMNCRDIKYFCFEKQMFIDWFDGEMLEAVSSLIAQLLKSCPWVQFRRLCALLVTQLLQFLSQNSTGIACRENLVTICGSLVCDIDPFVRSTAAHGVLHNLSLDNEAVATKLRFLLADHKSNRVRLVVTTAIRDLLKRDAESAKLVGPLFGDMLLKMLKLDPSVQVRSIAADSVACLVSYGNFPLHLSDALPLLSYDLATTFVRPLCDLIWAIVDGGTAETGLPENLNRLMSLMKTNAVTEDQAVLLLCNLKHHSWRDLAKIIIHYPYDGDEDQQLAFKLLVRWTEYSSDCTKKSHKSGTKESKALFNLVLSIVDHFQSTQALIARGIYFLCFAALQEDYREFDYFKEKCESFCDLFLNKSGEDVTRAVGEFWNYLYEDEDYRPWIKSQLDPVVASIQDHSTELTAYQKAILCGSVIEPCGDLGSHEIEALTRYLERKIEFEVQMDADQLAYVQRLVELGKDHPQSTISILKTVGKYAMKAKGCNWPQLEFTKQSTEWLVEMLWRSDSSGIIELAQCILGLWYYDVIPGEVIDDLRSVASSNVELAKEIEDIQLC